MDNSISKQTPVWREEKFIFPYMNSVYWLIAPVIDDQFFWGLGHRSPKIIRDTGLPGLESPSRG